MIRVYLDKICRSTFDSIYPVFPNVRRVKISISVYYNDKERYDTEQIFNCKSFKLFNSKSNKNENSKNS